MQVTNGMGLHATMHATMHVFMHARVHMHSMQSVVSGCMPQTPCGVHLLSNILDCNPVYYRPSAAWQLGHHERIIHTDGWREWLASGDCA